MKSYYCDGNLISIILNLSFKISNVISNNFTQNHASVKMIRRQQMHETQMWVIIAVNIEKFLDNIDDLEHAYYP